jgi:methylmalonyl-CoA mutase N-terminal domain/subunit
LGTTEPSGFSTKSTIWLAPSRNAAVQVNAAPVRPTGIRSSQSTAVTPSLRNSSSRSAASVLPSATVGIRASQTATAATAAMNSHTASVLIAPSISDLRYTRLVTRAQDGPPKPRAPKLRKTRFATDADIEIKGAYTAADAPAAPPNPPGEFPYGRGVQETMYRGQLWTMRQYAGFGTAAESNRRYKYLLAQGSKGLSVAFDLPTQMGRDSDHPMARGEVGRVGVAIDSLEDMRVLFDGIPLAEVSTSMTINATAATLLALYQAVGEEQGASPGALRGTIQNDILKEYIARGTYIYPPAASMRLITDTFTYCSREIPQWNTVSISGYHIREAGSDAVQEIAFTLADGIAYVEAALAAGLDVDEFAPRLSFFFNVHNNFIEEVAKFRAARALWAQIMRDRFHAKNPKSQMLRFHSQTSGVTLQAQQPLVNVIRVTLQTLAAVLGGTQSLHTNGYDEALSLPTEEAARIALRTQQVVGHESGVADFIDPLGGSWAVESLTAEIERKVAEYFARIEELGGMVRAIEAGYPQREIERRAYEHQRAVEGKQRIIVGVNDFVVAEESAIDIARIDPALEADQVQRVAALRSRRSAAEVSRALTSLDDAAAGTANLVVPIVGAVKALATVGEIADVMRARFGEYHPAR